MTAGETTLPRLECIQATVKGYIAQLTLPVKIAPCLVARGLSELLCLCAWEGVLPNLSSCVENWQFMSGCVFVLESSWMVLAAPSGIYTPSRSVLLWDWGGGEVNSVRKLHRGWWLHGFNTCKHCAWTKMNNWWGNPLYSLFSFSTDYESTRTKVNPFVPGK